MGEGGLLYSVKLALAVLGRSPTTQEHSQIQKRKKQTKHIGAGREKERKGRGRGRERERVGREEALKRTGWEWCVLNCKILPWKGRWQNESDGRPDCFLLT